jgi:hypothetical protein
MGKQPWKKMSENGVGKWCGKSVLKMVLENGVEKQ